MNPFRPRRSLAAGFLLFSGPVALANDWDCLHNLCGHKSCAPTTRVTLPAREVVVETEQPRVSVREISAAREVVSRSARRSIDVGAVPIGTVYMPLALPTFGFAPVGFGGVAAEGTRSVTRDVVRECDELSGIESANRAERDAVRRRAALHEELQLSMDNHNRAIQQIGATRGLTPAARDSASIEAKLTKLSDDISALNNRVKSVETLLIYHDNYIKAQVETGRPPAPPAPPAIPVADPVAKPSAALTTTPGTMTAPTPPK